MTNQAQKIRIGWASRDITPDKPVSLWGQFHVRISERVNDPLTATALALESEDQRQQAIMVSIDAVCVDNPVRDKCRELLKEKLDDFDPSMLFINTTHTHTAPVHSPNQYPEQAPNVMSAEEYFEVLMNGITTAAVEAWQHRTPGAVSWGCGQAVVGFNRRMTYFDGASKMYGDTNDPNFSHLEGHEDHGVDLLFTYNSDKRLAGMIVNLACPSQVTETDNFVSADFWHETKTEIRRRHGKELFIMPQCSAAGDQSPHLMLKKKAEVRMLELKGLLEDGTALRMAERTEIGNRIADAVDEALPPASKDIHDTVSFHHKTVIVELPRRIVTADDLKFAQQQVKHYKTQLDQCEYDPAGPDYSSNYIQLRRFQDVVDRCEDQKTNPVLPVELHIIRLGDIAFATDLFEYFLDYGDRIKARSRAIQTFVVQLAGAGTYLPTEKAVGAKSYGAGIESNLVGPEGGQMIVEESVKTINTLFKES